MRVGIVLAALSMAAPLAHATPPGNGEVVESTPCRGHSESYAAYRERTEKIRDALVAESEKKFAAAKGTPAEATLAKGLEDMKRWPFAPEADYQRVFTSGELECTRVVYGSDGLKVVAYVLRQAKQTPGAPILLSLRGGNRDFGKVDERYMAQRMAPFAAAGYVVVAPQYRGADGGEGKDEFGGADVHDVLNVVPVAKKLPNVAPDDLVVAGGSRGGMMTYLALAQGLSAKAAVVVAGPVDNIKDMNDRPEMRQMMFELIPDFDKRGDDALRERSVINFVDKLHTPILIMHGTADWRVRPAGALELAEKLLAAKKPFGLFLYPDGDHGLSAYAEDVVQRSLAWFAKARAPQPPAPPRAP